MEKEKKNTAKMVLLASAIVTEIAAIIILVKAVSTDSSPATGLAFLAIGMVFLILGVTKKSEGGKPEGG